MREENQLENKVSEESFKELFTESPVFPLLTCGGKVLTMMLTQEPGNVSTFGDYLAFSSMADFFIFVGRVLTLQKKSPPYSCFERHLLYDLPKAVYEEIKCLRKGKGR